jgi:hypothetical protein
MFSDVNAYLLGHMRQEAFRAFLKAAEVEFPGFDSFKGPAFRSGSRRKR